MNITQLLLKELSEETKTTRKFLEIVPDDQYDWQPHPKSMTVRRLAAHIADLPNWIAMALTTIELDFANNDWKEEPINNNGELLAAFDRAVANGTSELSQATEDQYDEIWTLRNGEHIISKRTRYEVIRMTFGQMSHHRAQLGVFLRLLDIPIAGSYGPSADEM